MKCIKLFVVVSFISSLVSAAMQEPTRTTVILGSIQFENSLDQGLELPILYKGNEYEAKIEEKGDKKKAHFELYEQSKPTELFMVITEYLTLPAQTSIKHLSTSSAHSYRLWKLTLCDDNDTNMWTIKELDHIKKNLSIPDATIIFFMNPEMIDHLEPTSWQQNSSIMRLPTIVFKKNISKEDVSDVAAKMKLAFLDFKFFHKKTHSAFVPYANNRILSMPCSPRRIVA